MQLQKIDPTLPIPRNRKQPSEEGWAMIDVGNVAIHVLSKAARQKYFGPDQWGS
jgi:ribosomal silencing factor RsfS